MVLRPRIVPDIEPREPEILGRREGEAEPGVRVRVRVRVVSCVRERHAL